MKRFLYLLLLVHGFANGQGIKTPNKVTGVYEYQWLYGDSVLAMPQSCGVPIDTPKRSAIARDTCNQVTYIFDVHTRSWYPLSDGSTGAFLPISDTASMLAPYVRALIALKYSDTTSMLAPYAKTFQTVTYGYIDSLLSSYALVDGSNVTAGSVWQISINGAYAVVGKTVYPIQSITPDPQGSGVVLFADSVGELATRSSDGTVRPVPIGVSQGITDSAGIIQLGGNTTKSIDIEIPDTSYFSWGNNNYDLFSPFVEWGNQGLTLTLNSSSGTGNGFGASTSFYGGVPSDTITSYVLSDSSILTLTNHQFELDGPIANPDQQEWMSFVENPVTHITSLYLPTVASSNPASFLQSNSLGLTASVPITTSLIGAAPWSIADSIWMGFYGNDTSKVFNKLYNNYLLGNNTFAGNIIANGSVALNATTGSSNPTYPLAQFDGSGILHSINPKVMVFANVDTSNDKLYALANKGYARQVADSTSYFNRTGNTISLKNQGDSVFIPVVPSENGPYYKLVKDSAGVWKQISQNNMQRLAYDVLSKSPFLIRCMGTSLTYSQQDPGGPDTPINGATQMRAAYQYPETMDSVLRANGVSCHVINNGFPGDRIIDGLARWDTCADIWGTTPVGLVIMEYCTNDATNQGNHPGGGTPLTIYKSDLLQFAEHWLEAGAAVAIQLPPHLLSVVQNSELQPYRAALMEMAQELNLPILDADQAIDWMGSIFYDGVHLSAPAYSEWGASTAAFLLNKMGGHPQKVGPGDKFYVYGGLHSNGATFGYSGSTKGALLQINAGTSLSIAVDVISSCTLSVSTINASPGVARQLTASYGYGNAVIPNITWINDGSSGSGDIRQKLFGLSPGLRVINITNTGSQVVYIDEISFDGALYTNGRDSNRVQTATAKDSIGVGEDPGSKFDVVDSTLVISLFDNRPPVVGAGPIIALYAKNGGSAKTEYAEINSSSEDGTPGAERGGIVFQTRLGGTLGTRFHIEGNGNIDLDSVIKTAKEIIEGAAQISSSYDNRSAVSGNGGVFTSDWTGSGGGRIHGASFRAYSFDGTIGAEKSKGIIATMQNGILTDQLIIGTDGSYTMANPIFDNYLKLTGYLRSSDSLKIVSSITNNANLSIYTRKTPAGADSTYINFYFPSSNSDSVRYAAVTAYQNNSTAGSEQSGIAFSVINGGVLLNRLKLDFEGNLTDSGNYLPALDSTFNIGSSTVRFNNLSIAPPILTPGDAYNFVVNDNNAKQVRVLNGSSLPFAPNAGGTNYIQNQDFVSQPAHAWISGSFRVDSALTVAGPYTALNGPINAGSRIVLVSNDSGVTQRNAQNTAYLSVINYDPTNRGYLGNRSLVWDSASNVSIAGNDTVRGLISANGGITLPFNTTFNAIQSNGTSLPLFLVTTASNVVQFPNNKGFFNGGIGIGFGDSISSSIVQNPATNYSLITSNSSNIESLYRGLFRFDSSATFYPQTDSSTASLGSNIFRWGRACFAFAPLPSGDAYTLYGKDFSTGQSVTIAPSSLPLAPSSGSTNYIQNRTSTQSTSNFNVSGAGTVGTTLTAPAIVGSGSAPSIAAGTGAGTSPTVSIIGTQLSGQITVTTGTITIGTNATVATITYPNASAWSTSSFPVLYPGNAATALLSGATMVYTAGSATNFLIVSGATALTSATTYTWYYNVTGK